MNILTVCYYGMYQDLSLSFVHAQMAAYAAQGHRVRVLIPIAWGKKDWDGSAISCKRRILDGVEMIPLRYLSLSGYGERGFNTRSALFSLRLALKRLLRDFEPDIIHAHTLGFCSSIGAWLKQRLSVPMVVTTHGSDSSIALENGEYEQMKALCGEADHIVAVSSVLAGKLRKCGTATPISTILNGFILQHLPEAQKKQPLSFIQVGQLSQQKRFDVTIRAFAKLRAAYPSATLTIIGQGSEREALQALCQELQITGAVRFLGQIDNREVLAEMAKHQFFVMPSVREGFGIVYLEAMACGCITVGTEGEGISDVIVSGENGFLVPADTPDAIVAAVQLCISEPQTAEHIAQQGLCSARQLTWQKNAASYLQLFSALTPSIS